MLENSQKQQNERLSRLTKGANPFRIFRLGKTHQIDWWSEKCPGSVPPKYIPNQFRFRNLKKSGHFAADFPFVVDDSLNLLTIFFTHRKIPWSQPQLAGIERFDPPFGGWQNRANLPGWSIMLGWCSPFLPRCVKRGGNDPC